MPSSLLPLLVSMRSGSRRRVAGYVRSVALTFALSLVGVSARAQAPATPPPAAAATQPSAEDLRRHGNDAMAALRPGEALEDYKQAYALSKEPALLYNMAHALEALQDYPEALRYYEQFAREASPELKGRVPRLAELVAEIRAKVTYVTVTCNVPGARVLVRDRAVGPVPTDGKLSLALGAGPANVEVNAEGYGLFRRQVVFPGGGSSLVDVELVAKDRAGVIAVQTTPVGGEVVIDDKRVGTAPAELTVAVGSHTLVVRHPGYDDVTTQVVVHVGERREVTVGLEKRPGLTQRWWFWTGLGVVVVGGVVLTAALLTERSPDLGTIAPGQTRAPLVRW